MNKSRLVALLNIFIILLIIGIGIYAGGLLLGHRGSEKEIASLFDKWNQSLQTGDPHKVTALYDKRAILLPTLSSKARLTQDEREEYFRHFLENRPSAKIDFRRIEIGKDIAVDSGLYTFTFAKTKEKVKGRYSFVYKWDGKRWLIVSHHSSLMPEGKRSK